jgi:hypothetical protein
MINTSSEVVSCIDDEGTLVNEVVELVNGEIFVGLVEVSFIGLGVLVLVYLGHVGEVFGWFGHFVEDGFDELLLILYFECVVFL